jgi:hypothetical protein
LSPISIFFILLIYVKSCIKLQIDKTLKIK